MNPALAAALAQAKQTNQAVPVNMGTYTLMAYPNGQVGPQAGLSGAGGGTARWTPQQTPQIPQQPVQPSNPFNAAGVQGLPGSPSGAAVSPPSSAGSTGNPATYTDPTTLQSFSYVPSTGAIVASGPGYGTGTVIPQTSTSGPAGSTGPVDRHDAVAAQARVYRINHGLATSDDSAATDALNAESLAAANAGRTYLNRDLAAQYGQTPAAGVSGPRTDVVNALLMPPSTTPGTAYAQQQPATQSPYARQQPIVLAPTTATSVYNPAAATQQANSLLAQGIY